jgi:hypothetical protein
VTRSYQADVRQLNDHEILNQVSISEIYSFLSIKHLNSDLNPTGLLRSLLVGTSTQAISCSNSLKIKRRQRCCLTCYEISNIEYMYSRMRSIVRYAIMFEVFHLERLSSSAGERSLSETRGDSLAHRCICDATLSGSIESLT